MEVPDGHSQRAGRLTGPVVIGTFVGTKEDKGRQFLLVKYFRQAWSKDTEARIEFTAFDPRTGQPTQVGDSLRKIASGTVVAVGVDVDARPWNKGAFPTFVAESVHTVEPVTSDGIMRGSRYEESPAGFMRREAERPGEVDAGDDPYDSPTLYGPENVEA